MVVTERGDRCQCIRWMSDPISVYLQTDAKAGELWRKELRAEPGASDGINTWSWGEHSLFFFKCTEVDPSQLSLLKLSAATGCWNPLWCAVIFSYLTAEWRGSVLHYINVQRIDGKEKKKTLKDTRKIQNLQWVVIWSEANIKLITNRDTHTPFVPVCICYLMSNVQLVIQAVWGNKPEVNLWIKWGDITFLSGWTQLLSWLVFLDHWASGSSPHTSSLPSWESGTAKMATAGDALHFGCTDTCDWCHDGSVSYFYSPRYKIYISVFRRCQWPFYFKWCDVMWVMCEWWR